MRIFVAGATGALGRRLIPLLVSAGHSVVGLTHREENAGIVASLGAEPAVADGLDGAAVPRPSSLPRRRSLSTR